jgi:hypothetical protein
MADGRGRRRRGEEDGGLSRTTSLYGHDPERLGSDAPSLRDVSELPAPTEAAHDQHMLPAHILTYFVSHIFTDFSERYQCSTAAVPTLGIVSNFNSQGWECKPQNADKLLEIVEMCSHKATR